MNRHIVKEMAAPLLFAVIASTAAWAVDGPPGGRMGPPPEAIEACKDKNEGAKVDITTPNGEQIPATCREIGGQLVALPGGGFRGPEPPNGRKPGSDADSPLPSNE